MGGTAFVAPVLLAPALARQLGSHVENGLGLWLDRFMTELAKPASGRRDRAGGSDDLTTAHQHRASAGCHRLRSGARLRRVT